MIRPCNFLFFFKSLLGTLRFTHPMLIVIAHNTPLIDKVRNNKAKLCKPTKHPVVLIPFPPKQI